MIRYVLTIFVIAIIVAVAYLALFTPGKAEPVSPVTRGSPDAMPCEAGVMELELRMGVFQKV
jgi:hypothetical protein